jgi:hypothetical protein
MLKDKMFHSQQEPEMSEQAGLSHKADDTDTARLRNDSDSARNRLLSEAGTSVRPSGARPSTHARVGSRNEANTPVRFLTDNTRRGISASSDRPSDGPIVPAETPASPVVGDFTSPASVPEVRNYPVAPASVPEVPRTPGSAGSADQHESDVSAHAIAPILLGEISACVKGDHCSALERELQVLTNDPVLPQVLAQTAKDMQNTSLMKVIGLTGYEIRDSGGNMPNPTMKALGLVGSEMMKAIGVSGSEIKDSGGNLVGLEFSNVAGINKLLALEKKGETPTQARETLWRVDGGVDKLYLSVNPETGLRASRQ